MAGEHYKDSVEIKRGSSFREFDSAEVGHHISPEVIESGDIKFIHPDKIAYKIQLSTFNRTYIDVDLCKTLEKKDNNFPSDDAVKQLADAFAEKVSVNVWLDRHMAPIFTSSTDKIVLLDTDLYESSRELSLGFLVDSTNMSEFNVEDWYLVSSDMQVWYVRNKLGLSKLFTPYCLEYFDDMWPGLMVSNEYEDGERISKLGFRALLQSFIFSTGAYLNTSSEIYPKNVEFNVSIPLLINSDLNGGVTLEKKQTKQLEHMLPSKVAKDDKRTSSFDKNILTSAKEATEIFDEHKDVTWNVFISAMEMFPVGCSIFFGHNQVILDSDDRLVFSTGEIKTIIYHGPEFVLTPKRNTIDVVVNGKTIENSLRARLVEYFDDAFDLSVHTIRTEDNASEILTGDNVGLKEKGYLL